MPHWIEGSTKRIAQMSGDYDPEGLTHFNNTGAWGVDGVDLGANTEHNDRTFIFFGDVPLRPGRQWPPQDSDLVAFIEDVPFPHGGHLATARQSDHQVDVFYIGDDQKLNVHWVVGGGSWQGPVALSPQPVAPPGASLAPIMQVSNQLSVLFIGNDQKLNVHWVIGGGIWQGPVALSPQPVAPPGASLAAIKQQPNQSSVLFIGNDHKLNVQSVTGGGAWQGPLSLGAGPVAPPGGGVALVTQVAGQTSALFVGEHGGLLVQWVAGGGAWQGPVQISPANVAPAGTPLVATQQLTDLTAVLFGGPSVELQLAWVKGGGTWQGPVHINPQMVKLTPVLKDSAFHPFTVREAQRTWLLGSDATPTGAFSYDGKVFVFVVAREGVTISSLTKSCCPAEPVPFDLVFRFSFESDLDGGKFWQVAPCVVRSAELPGLKTEAAEGAILLGHGFTRRPGAPFGVHLAWLPLSPGRDPDLGSIRYYTGAGADNWSAHEGDAAPLFTTRFGWSSLSVGRIPGPDLWITLYHTAGSRDDIKTAGTANAPIVARIAATPWELAGAAEIPIFDPARDAALGHYMYRPDLPDPNNLRLRGGPLIGHPSFLYGPYLLNHYTHFDARTSVVTLYYLVSTGWPYQVQLMRSAVKLETHLHPIAD